ncbi:glycosyltransferase [Enterococcus cecorum]|nr:glycosyltransferase [Enterococcus cecorum]
MSLTKRIIFTLAFLFSVIYLAWRGLFTLPFHQAWWVLVFGILLWLCEVVSTFTGMILIYNKQKAKKLSKPQANAKDYPDVDVLIATHNEDVALLRKTVNACVKMKYPDKQKKGTYLSL